MIEAVGYVGTAGAATMWIPQVVRAIRQRHHRRALESISLTTYGVAVLFNVLLATYGLVQGARPVILAGAVNLVCASVIVSVVVSSGRRRARSAA